MKKKAFIFVSLLSLQILFSSEVFAMDIPGVFRFDMEIKARYIPLIAKAYNHNDLKVIDLTDYVIEILSRDGILHLRFSNPTARRPGQMGSPPRYPTVNFQIDIETGEILRIFGER